MSYLEVNWLKITVSVKTLPNMDGFWNNFNHCKTRCLCNNLPTSKVKVTIRGQSFNLAMRQLEHYLPSHNLGSLGHCRLGYYLHVHRVLLSILKCIPGTENILSRTRPILTVPRDLFPPKMRWRKTRYGIRNEILFEKKPSSKMLFEQEFR